MNPLPLASRFIWLNWKPFLPLTEFHVEILAPHSAGVYKIAMSLPDGNRQIVYVGQASDLKSRVKDHLHHSGFNFDLYSILRSYPCEFAFAEVPLQADRDAAERALFYHFLPVCNSLVPFGSDCLVLPLMSA